MSDNAITSATPRQKLKDIEPRPNVTEDPESPRRFRTEALKPCRLCGASREVKVYTPHPSSSQVVLGREEQAVTTADTNESDEFHASPIGKLSVMRGLCFRCMRERE